MSSRPELASGNAFAIAFGFGRFAVHASIAFRIGWEDFFSQKVQFRGTVLGLFGDCRLLYVEVAIDGESTGGVR